MDLDDRYSEHGSDVYSDEYESEYSEETGGASIIKPLVSKSKPKKSRVDSQDLITIDGSEDEKECGDFATKSPNKNNLPQSGETRRKWNSWHYAEKLKLCQAIVEQKGQHETAGNYLWEKIYYNRREDFARHTVQSIKEKFRKKLRFELDSYLLKDQIATFPDDIATKTPRTEKNKPIARAKYDDSTFIPMLKAIAESGDNENPNIQAFWDIAKLNIPVLANRTSSALLQQYRLKIKDHLTMWKHMFNESMFESIMVKCRSKATPTTTSTGESAATTLTTPSLEEDVVKPTVPVQVCTLTNMEEENIKQLMVGVRVLQASMKSTNAKEKFHAETTFQVLESLAELAQQRQKSTVAANK